LSALCPDTMVFVSIITKERGWRKWPRRISNADERVLLQCVLFEIAKVCEREYFKASIAFCDKKEKTKVLAKYEANSPIVKIASVKTYSHQLVELDSLINNIPQDVCRLISHYNMKIFPDPFQSNYSVLEYRKEIEPDIKKFIKRTAPLPMQEIVMEKLENYIQKYRLERYVEEAERSLPESWPQVEKNDKFLLATYLKARETWSQLQILTSDEGLKEASNECPSKFFVLYFK